MWYLETLLFLSGGLNNIPPKLSSSILHLLQFGFIAIYFLFANKNTLVKN